VEHGQEGFIRDNMDVYYDSMLYVDGERPWDIVVYVDIFVDDFNVMAGDGTRIVTQIYLEYNDTGEASFTLSVPLNSSFLEGEEDSEYDLTILLYDDLEIELGKTDKEVEPFVYQNRTGLSISREQLEGLEDRRYEIRIKGDDTESEPLLTYIGLGILCVFIAGIIFFAYNHFRYKAQEKREEEEAQKMASSKNKGPKGSEKKKKGSGKKK
jgi:hypothetical protein